MRRALRWTGRVVAVLAAVLVVLMVVLLAGANTQPGRSIIARLAPRLTGGMVTIHGLSGRFPDRLKAARVSLRDKDGLWARINDLRLDWEPLRLVGGTIAIERLAAAKITVLRRPVSSGASASSSQLALDIDTLHVGRIDLAPAVSGIATSLALDGSAAIAASGNGRVAVAVKGVGAPGNYHLTARLGAADLALSLKGEEPARGLVSAIAGLPALGPLSVDASFAGPRARVAGRARLAVGPARLLVEGTLDLKHRSADLVATGSAPAMAPRPDLSWQRAAFDGRIDGSFARPQISATLDIAALRAAQVSLAHIAARLGGDAGRLRLKAGLEGLRIPGPRPDLLAATPVEIAASVRLGRPDRPIRFSLAHPLLRVAGRAATAGRIHGRMQLTLPDLAPLAAAAGLDLKGHAALDLRTAVDGATTRLDADGTVGITGGTAPAPALIGDAAHLTLAAAATARNISVSRLAFDGPGISMTVNGNIDPKKLALDWRLALPDLTSAVPRLAGTVELQGRASGPIDNIAATTDLSGTLGPIGGPVGPVTAKVALRGLPDRPSGRVTAEGTIFGAPLRLVLAGRRVRDGGLKLVIDEADWKSAHAAGSFALAGGARFPLGRLELRMTRLDDLRPFVGRPVTGAVDASLTTTQTGGQQRAELRLAADNVGLAGTAAGGRVELSATVTDPLSHPILVSRVVARGRSAGGIAASAELRLTGPENALALSARSEISDPKTGVVRFETAGTVDAVTRVAALSRLEALWKDEDLHLLAPARVGFGNGLTVEHLRLGLRGATIEANGRLSPTLDLSVALRNLSPQVVAPFAPDLDADGVLRGDARLTGTPQRPVGRITLAAAGLRLRSGSARALPAANFRATADLAGSDARIVARLTAGPSANLSIDGRLSTATSGPIALHVAGALDLAMFDPLLTASGRRATGKITLDGDIGGSLKAPRIGGAARLTDATIEDFALGLRITGINGSIAATGTTLRLTRLEGRAGQGTIAIDGTVGLAAPGMPVNLDIRARNARPLASDLLTAHLDADLHLHGTTPGGLVLGGRVDVLQARIGIPKSMPATVPVLPVRVAGAPLPLPPAPPPSVGLDLTIAARHVVVSGRGLLAELAGSIKVGGTTAAPRPLGSFHMVRGNLNIAGQTLTFDTGEVGFNGGSLTDPSLNFVISSQTPTMSGSLTIGGTASRPTVTVTSTPEMPADEALSRMLYPNSNAAPSPLQLAAIAASLAELSGAGSGGGPLEGLRHGLGLEQLSVGTTANGSSALEAGRYVAPGVYVGAQQGAGGNSSQAKVEIDIARGLKVIGTVGNGANTTPGATPAQSAGTSLGIQYQFQY
jgi:translocation and assembly module TamB